MRSQNARLQVFIFALILNFALTATAAAATHEKWLHIFSGTPVKSPNSGLIPDPAGNLYGVATGAVYELSPISGGGFTYRVLSTLLAGAVDFAALASKLAV
jgi:hypothetical protein